MAAMEHYVLVTFLIVAIISPCISSQPPSADDVIERDRTSRQAAIKAGINIATAPKRGFFGTIFHVILEQINDTKSAYSQISELVNNQFIDDNIGPQHDIHEICCLWEPPQLQHANVIFIIRYLPGFASAVTSAPGLTINGTTETPKITRAEFLRILDRNLKGLNRLRNLEWREAKKDSAANLRAYKDEIFRGKKATNKR